MDNIQTRQNIMLHKLSTEAAKFRSTFINDKNGHHNIIALIVDKKWRVLCKRRKLL